MLLRSTNLCVAASDGVGSSFTKSKTAGFNITYKRSRTSSSLDTVHGCCPFSRVLKERIVGVRAWTALLSVNSTDSFPCSSITVRRSGRIPQDTASRCLPKKAAKQ